MVKLVIVIHITQTTKVAYAPNKSGRFYCTTGVIKLKTNEIKDIELLLARCTSQIDMYRNRAIESTIIHDADGTEHEPTKQLFKKIERCKHAVELIKTKYELEVE